MQLRDHQGVKGKRDAYPFDPRLLKIMDGYNVRDLDTEEARAKLDELKESIRANGVKVPLEVKFDGEDVFVLAGHRRHKATMELIAEGEPIETVLIIAEQKGTNDAERTLNLAISNSGEPLKPLEMAEIVRRLTAYGWDAGQIAKRLGWKSKATVAQHLEMLALPEPVKQHVRDNEISATLARNIAKGVDPEQAEKLIRDNLEENRKIKGKRAKVTAKTLKRDAKPKADKLPIPARAPRQSETKAQEPASSVAPESVPLSADDRNTLQERWLAGQVGEAADKVRILPEGFKFEPVPPIKDVIEALAPWAKIIEGLDLSHRDDAETVTVHARIGDLKRAFAVHARATGAEG